MTRSFAIDQLPAGTEMAGYRLEGLLGKGGMGAVYLATQLSIGRKVALKIFRPRGSGDQSQRTARFLNEARTAARFSHPALVAIHEVGVDAEHDLHYFSMEYIHGRTLATVVTQEGKLGIDRALAIAEQVAAALEHAHRQGACHRDVKPENILVESNGRARLADLGLTAPAVRNPMSSGERVLSIIGTPGWSAPEQLRNPQRAGPAADVFSLGCCLSFMLTGVKPYTGETLIDLAVRVCTEAPLGIDQLPPALQSLVQTLTAIDLQERPADGTAALALLRAPLTATSESSRLRRRRIRRR